jgi:putative hydrolase of the HAD superfamily
MDNIKHIFFDLDHTLWDFEKNSQEALFEIFNSRGFDKLTPGFNRFYKKYSEINKRYWNLYQQNLVTKQQVREERFCKTLDFFNIDNSKEIGIEVSQDYVKISPYKTHLFPGTHELLTELSQQYKLHIITNGFVEVQQIKLSQSDLAKYFDIVVCSEETGKKKPHKDVYNFALNKAGAIASESIMIGDSIVADVIGANKAGLTGIWFNPLFEATNEKVIEINSLAQLSSVLKD